MRKWHIYECPFAKAPPLSNSLPKQGGLGWVFSFREGWGGVVFKPFTANPYYFTSYIIL